MFRSLDDRSFRLLFLSLFVGLVIALGVAGSNVYFHTEILEDGDAAINALQIDNAKHFSELYGNYSRYEFNHPGPAFFYVYAAGEWLFHDVLEICPSPHSAHLLACMLLQSAFFALMLSLIAQFVAWRAVLPVALIAAALHFGHLRSPFMSVWPPHVLTMPFLAFLVSCISFSLGRTKHAIFMVLTGGFLFHGHVAQPLFVVGLGTLTIGLTVWRIRHSDTVTAKEYFAAHRRVWMVCGAIAAVFLLPLAIDVLRLGTKSNLATIIGRFMANREDSKSLLQSFLYFLSFATYDQHQDLVFSKLGPELGPFFRAYSFQVVAWLLVLLAPPLIAFLIRQRLSDEERRFFFTSYLMLGITIVLCVFWGIAQAGPMFNFNGFFYYGIYFFALLLALSLALRGAERLGFAPLAACGCAAAAVGFTTLFELDNWTPANSGITTTRAIQTLLNKAPKTAQPRFLVFEHHDWPQVASVALYLQRHNIQFYTSPWWEFMFGQRHDSSKLGDSPETCTDVWWIAKSAEGGIPITSELSVFTKPAPLSPDSGVIKMAGGENCFRYVVTGLNVGNTEYAWTNQKLVTFLFAPQHADRDVTLVFDAMSWKRDKALVLENEPAEIIFNGRSLGQLVARERSELSINIPVTLWNQQPEAKLVLRFPSVSPHHSLKRPRYTDWHGWGIWKLKTHYTK